MKNSMKAFGLKAGRWIFLGVLLLGGPAPAATETTAPAADSTKIIQVNLKILKTQTNPLETRKMSAGLLMDLGKNGAQDHLLKILTDPSDKQAQLAVIEALADRDEPEAGYIKPLIDILLSGDPELRSASTTALGRYRNKDLTDELIQIASDPKRLIAQRLPAIETLGKIRTKQTVEALLLIMEKAPANKNDQAEIESACTQSLFELTHADLGIDLPAWKLWWEQNKNKNTTQWLESQLDVVTGENRDLKKRLDQTEKALIETIGKLYQINSSNEADRIKLLQSYLSGNLPAERRAGLEIMMALISPKQPVPDNLKPVIRNLIDDPDPGVRMACAKTLALSGDREAVDQMFKQLDAETSPMVKQAWLLAIGQLGDKSILEKLIQQLNSPLEPICAGAGKAIAKIFQSQKDMPNAMKDQTIQALLMRYKQTTPEQSSLRQELLATMTDENVADPRFLQVFKEEFRSQNAETRRFAAKGIAALRDEKLATLLVGQLNDSEPAVRAELATGIASLTSDPKAVESLLARINTNVENDNQVRQTTWNAILTMISRWSIDQQLDWANLAPRSEGVGMESLNQLVDLLNRQITEQSATWPADRKVGITVKFGSFLLKINRPEEALKYFQQAISTSRQLAPKESAALADRLLTVLLGATRSETILSQYLNNLAGVLDQTQLQAIIDRFVRWADQPVNRPVGIKISNQLSGDLMKNLSEASKKSLSVLKQPPASQPATQATSKPS
jgi:HEAT repeat protein